MWPLKSSDVFGETNRSDLGYVSPATFGWCAYVAPEFGLVAEVGEIRDVADPAIRLIIRGKHNSLQSFWNRVNELRNDPH